MALSPFLESEMWIGRDPDVAKNSIAFNSLNKDKDLIARIEYADMFLIKLCK